ELAVADDPALIPFLVAYDGDAIVGIGAVLAGGEPGPVEIVPGRISKYDVDLVPTSPASDAIGPRQHLEVACGSWRSGIAWRPNDGTQLRLLLPDLEDDPAATDARTRALDLDCDAHDAPGADCDDLRARYHAGTADACDGEDTNCDGQRLIVQDCPLSGGVCAPGPTNGVQLCDDSTGEPIGTCVGDPACACRNGDPTCHRCVLDFRATPDVNLQETCTPAVALISLAAYCSETEPCTVDVVPRGGRFEAKISSDPLVNYGSRVTGVHDGIYLLVKNTAGELPAIAGDSVGAIYLAITSGSQTRHVGIDLALAVGATDACLDFGGGFFKMQCL
ncbi:MAG TPA: putative metal-binding motif-containing protein, partial [Kofleriaceae bacterium]